MEPVIARIRKIAAILIVGIMAVETNHKCKIIITIVLITISNFLTIKHKIYKL
jgi:hypothetical protein